MAGLEDDEELLTVAEVARLTGIEPHSLAGLRTRGHGPPWELTAVGLRYRRAAVEAWLERVLPERERRAQARRRPAPDEDEDLDEEDGEEHQSWFNLPFEERLQLVRSGLARLHATIRAECPGPHEYVAHDDDGLPWCRSCGYADCGLSVTELPQWQHDR
jgi:hypothetical protein